MLSSSPRDLLEWRLATPVCARLAHCLHELLEHAVHPPWGSESASACFPCFVFKVAREFGILGLSLPVDKLNLRKTSSPKWNMTSVFHPQNWVERELWKTIPWTWFYGPGNSWSEGIDRYILPGRQVLKLSLPTFYRKDILEKCWLSEVYKLALSPVQKPCLDHLLQFPNFSCCLREVTAQFMLVLLFLITFGVMSFIISLWRRRCLWSTGFTPTHSPDTLCPLQDLLTE